MKKLLSFLLLVTIIVAGCSNSTSTGGCVEEGALEVISPVHVKSQEEAELWSDYVTEQVGFEVNMRYVESEYDTVLQSAFSSDTCYDAIYTTLPTMMNDEYAVKLDEKISSSDILGSEDVIPSSAYDDVKNYSGQDSIYGIPNKYEGNLVTMYRSDWLSEFGLSEPTTLDEWYNFFETAKNEKDAYGYISAELYDIQPFMSSVGVKYGFVENDNGEWEIPYVSQDSKVVYEFLEKLYENGLYEPNLLQNGSGEMRDKLMAGEVAATGYWDTWVGLMNDLMSDNTDFRVDGSAPVLDPQGNGLVRQGNPGVFIINKNSQKVDNAFKLLEFMHSEEGNLLSTAGIPGHDYNVENGEYVFTEEGIEHGGDHGSPRVVTPGYENPYTEFPLEGASEATDKVINYGFIPNTQVGNWTDAEAIINKNMMNAIIDESITVEDALKSANDELQSILNEINE